MIDQQEQDIGSATKVGPYARFGFHKNIETATFGVEIGHRLWKPTKMAKKGAKVRPTKSQQHRHQNSDTQCFDSALVLQLACRRQYHLANKSAVIQPLPNNGVSLPPAN